MTFRHDLYPDRPEISEEYVDGQRFYRTPAGVFKSVTTIIGEKSDKGWLKAWRDRVGEEEADRILTQAGIRGTAIHSIAEKYVMNDPDWKRGAMPVNLWTFSKIRPILDANLDVVYGCEFPVYSGTLRTAGRTDLPARFAGVDAIVDFKSSRGKKEKEDIPGYFIQATAYAVMFQEITGIRMTHCVVIVAEDGSDGARVFVERCRDWYPEVARVFMSG